jgi:hypothetical protein
MLTGKDCFSGYLIPSFGTLFRLSLIFSQSDRINTIHSKADFFIFENNRSFKIKNSMNWEQLYH